MTESKRLNVVLPISIFQQLEKIAKDKQLSLTSVIRHAISLELWYSDVKNKQCGIITEREEQFYEVDLPYI